MKRKKKAFTLIELLAVIVIIGIIALIAVPNVSQYIFTSKKATYESYVKDMEGAAENYVVECLADNNGNCSIPTGGDRITMPLQELIDRGYTDALRDPEGDGYCNADKSYVIIQNDINNQTNYDYTACLYCSNYQSNPDSCVEFTDEGSSPKCGDVVGEGALWTNQNRTITVKCLPGDNDGNSACLKSEFSKTFTETMDTGTVSIQGQNGKVTACNVSVKIDKELPTCSLKVVSSVTGEEGWYPKEAHVELITKDDTGGSGLQTFGMGTSRTSRDYNRKTTLEVGNGITTVYGYVKDYAGNEGYCALEIKADKTSPTQTVDIGYQIFPNKEAFTLNQLSGSGTTYTSTGTDPYIDITGLSEYRKVSKVILYFNAGTTAAIPGQIYYRTSGGTYDGSASVTKTIPQGSTQFIFTIPEGTYDGIRIDLGNESGLSYNINRIELVVGDRSVLYTNKDVTVYVNDSDVGTGVTQYSYDNGASWIKDSSKRYSANATFNVMVKDKAGNTSEATAVSIQNIDKTAPSCTLSLTGTKPEGSSWYTTDVNIGFGSTTDTGGSGVRNYGLDSVSGSKTATLTTDSTDGVTYTGHIVDKAGNTNTCTTTVKRKANYTITYNSNSGTACPNGSAVYGKAYGTLCAPTRQYYTFNGWYTDSGLTNKVTATTVVSAYDDHTLYAGWTRNKITVTYAPNGGSGSNQTQSCDQGGTCTLKAANTFSRSGYSFQYWSNGSSNYSAGSNQVFTGNVTLNAIWKANCRSGYTIQSNGMCQKVYAASSQYVCTSGGWGGWQDRFSSYGCDDEPQSSFNPPQNGDVATRCPSSKNAWKAYCAGESKSAITGRNWYGTKPSACSRTCGTSSGCTGVNGWGYEISEYSCRSYGYKYSCNNGGSLSGTLCYDSYWP